MNEGETTLKKTFFITVALLCLAMACFGQQGAAWDKLEWLVGEWIGEGSGQPGQGGGTFSFSFDLDRNIIVRKSHSEYPAKDKPPVIHDDLMVIYCDPTGTPGRAIYFDNERHVIEYTVSCTGKSVVFTSEKTAAAPVFRLTYDPLGTDSVNVKFEMSRDGEKFMTYIEGKSARKR
jgi:hypothetical protein